MDIPGYTIKRPLGEGGMATVYLAVQDSLDREVALKVMTPGLSVDETYCHRFIKEGRIAAQLNHPNLLTVYDIGTHEDHYYLAGEYLPAGTARDRMERGLSHAEIVRMIKEVAAGLGFAHSRGFVHRDVKPGNMLFRDNGECVLGDFGIAKSVDSTTGATKLGTSIGTPHYMSPEQAKGEKVDHRTDLYSLGVVFWELLEGHPPYEDDEPFTVALMQVRDPVPSLSAENQRFQGIIEKLMAKDRERRYESAEAFIRDLEALTGGGLGSAGTRRDQAVSSPASSRRPLLWGIGAAALVGVLAIGAALYLGMGGEPPAESVDQPAADAREPAGAPNSVAILDRASEQAAANRYFEPGGDNAYESLQTALELEPGNERARQAMRQLPRQIEAAARTAWSEGRREQALKWLSQAALHFPSDRALAELSGTLQGSGEDVSDLLARARSELAADGALAATPILRQIVELDPYHEEARRMLQDIADSWADAAETYLARGDQETAMGMIRLGLRAKPDHARLIAMRQEIEGAQAD